MSGGQFCGDAGDPLDVLDANDWDFYHDIIFEGLTHISPIMYSPQLAYASVVDATDDWQTHKTRLYNLKDRRKQHPIYNDNLQALMNTLTHFNKSKSNFNYRVKIKEVFR